MDLDFRLCLVHQWYRSLCRPTTCDEDSFCPREMEATNRRSPPRKYAPRAPTSGTHTRHLEILCRIPRGNAREATHDVFRRLSLEVQRDSARDGQALLYMR